MVTDIESVFYLIIVDVILAYSHEGARYQLMDEFDVSLQGRNDLVFEIRSCAEAQLLLMHDKTNFQTDLYEIRIGQRHNSESTISKGSSGIPTSYPGQESLECDSIRTFWITWGGSTIHVGTGIVVGDNEFMSYNDSDPIEIKHVSVSPGYWVFHSSNCACCTRTPRYCQGLKNQGITESGVYSVTGAVSEVYCDMETDDGGWLVFQRRKDGSEDFYRGWDDYENGFGELAGEFWLDYQYSCVVGSSSAWKHRASLSIDPRPDGRGLIFKITLNELNDIIGPENVSCTKMMYEETAAYSRNRFLSMILSEGHYELRIDLEDWEGNKRHAKYQTFIVGNTWNNYKLTVCGYSGDAHDGMTYHNGMNFTTKDKDNDKAGRNCAEWFSGAWWYNKCHQSNLNALYLKGNHTSYANGVNWKRYHYSLKMTEMKIREVCKY